MDDTKCKMCGGDMPFDFTGNRRNRIGEHYLWSDCVKHLKSRIAELEAQQRWVHVSERLPYTAPVTMISKDLLLICDIPDDQVRKGYYDAAVEKWYLSDTRFSQEVIVTHWMPLPEPPEAHNGNNPC